MWLPETITTAGGVPQARPRRVTRSSRKRWPKPKRSLAVNCRATSISAISTSPIQLRSRSPGFLSVLSAQDAPLSELMQPFYKYSQSGEINFHVEDKDAKIREIAEVV